MLIDLARQLSFLIFSIGCFGISVFFAHSALISKHKSTFFNSLGFGLLSISSAINLINHAYSPASYWFATIAYFMLFIGIVIDQHSKFRLTFPIPLIAIYFLRNHELLFTLAFLVLIAHLYLSYKLTHQRLIPLVGIFTLVMVGEYIYSLHGSTLYPSVSEAGIFVYLFAALISVGWILFYLIREMINLMRNPKFTKPFV